VVFDIKFIVLTLLGILIQNNPVTAIEEINQLKRSVEAIS